MSMEHLTVQPSEANERTAVEAHAATMPLRAGSLSASELIDFDLRHCSSGQYEGQLVPLAVLRTALGASGLGGAIELGS